MKLGSFILSSFITSVTAAPAIVWDASRSSNSAIHSSDPVIVDELIDGFKNDSPSSESTVSAVIFLVGRDSNGNEGLSGLTKSGSLPSVSSKYNDAHTIHHHVWGIDGSSKVVKAARDEARKTRVLDLNLNEFNTKLSTFESKPTTEEAEISQDGTSKLISESDRVLKNSDIVIVNVSPGANTEVIDNVISRAVDHGMFKSVVLTAVRGTSEVKQEINMMNRRKLTNQSTKKQPSGRRRLDEQGEDEDGNNNNADKTGVYYVHMTPNIFAGILYMFLFLMVAVTGLNCMGQISNSDVYVSKMPPVGREA